MVEPAGTYLLINLRLQRFDAHFSLAGECELNEKGQANVDLYLVMIALALPLHFGISIKLAPEVAFEVIGEPGIGGPTVRVGRPWGHLHICNERVNSFRNGFRLGHRGDVR